MGRFAEGLSLFTFSIQSFPRLALEAL